MLNVVFLETQRKKFEDLKAEIKKANLAAKSLQEKLAEITSAKVNSTNDIEVLKKQAELKYEDIRRTRGDAESAIRELKKEFGSNDTKKEFNQIAENLEEIVFSRSPFNRNTILEKLLSFTGESALSVEHNVKAESKEKLERELRKSACVGVFFGSVYLTIDLLLTKSLEPLCSTEKDITETTVTTTPTEDSMTPIDSSTDDVSIIEGEGKELPKFNTNPDSSQESDTGATQIITEEAGTEIVVDQLFFNIVTVFSAMSVAIIITKIIYLLSKFITVKPIREKAELGEHTKTILDHAVNTKASNTIDKVIDYINEAEEILSSAAATERNGEKSGVHRDKGKEGSVLHR